MNAPKSLRIALASLLWVACTALAADGPTTSKAPEVVYDAPVAGGQHILTTRVEVPVPAQPTGPNIINPVHMYRLSFTRVSSKGTEREEVGCLYDGDFGKNNFADVDWRTKIEGVALPAPDTLVVVYKIGGALCIQTFGPDANGHPVNLLQPGYPIEMVGTEGSRQPRTVEFEGSFEKGGPVTVKIVHDSGAVLRLRITRVGDKFEWVRLDSEGRPLPWPKPRSAPASRPE